MKRQPKHLLNSFELIGAEEIIRQFVAFRGLNQLRTPSNAEWEISNAYIIKESHPRNLCIDIFSLSVNL